MDEWASFHRLQALFERAAVLSHEQRERYLARCRIQQPELADSLERLLHQDAQGTKAFLRPTVPGVEVMQTAPASRTQPGLSRADPEPSVDALPVLGNERYHIVRELARGGMGTVYLAQQREPVRREVAVKVLRPELGDRDAHSRLELERQAMATMDHPGIARVFDGGATVQGRPWFAMEYVEGCPLDAYARIHELDLDARLDLIQQVCDAVQHAHQKGVLHRDLKAANVLVKQRDGGPTAIVIDFGIAHWLDEPDEEEPASRTIVGSLGAMSPEQLRGEALDTRSDVYALGALAYELLVGRSPLDACSFQGDSLAEFARWAAEQEILAPSKAHAQLARERGLQGGIDLRTDLGWILLKALRSEPSERYASASELGADLKRYRDGWPVVAAPSSWRYRTRCFMRRHRTACLVSLVAAGLLVASSLIAVFGMLEAREQRDHALRQENHAVRTAGFLFDTLSMTDPRVSGRADLEVIDLIRWASARAGVAFGERIEEEARIRRALGQAFHTLGFVEEAAEELQRSHRLFEKTGTGPSLEAYLTLKQLALAHEDSGRRDGMEMRYRAGVMGAVLLGERFPELASQLDELRRAVEYLNNERALELLHAIEPLAEARLADRPTDRSLLADVIESMGHYLGEIFGQIESIDFLERAVVWRRTHEERDGLALARSLNALARTMQDFGRIDASEPRVRECLEIYSGLLPENHGLLLTSRSMLGACLARQSRPEEAEDLLRHSRRRLIEEQGASARATLEAGFRLLRYLDESDQRAAAEELRLELAVAITRCARVPQRWLQLERELFPEREDELARSWQELESRFVAHYGERLPSDSPGWNALGARFTQAWKALPAESPRKTWIARLLAGWLPYAAPEAIPPLGAMIDLAVEQLASLETEVPGTLADALVGQARWRLAQDRAAGAERISRRAERLYARAHGDHAVTAQLNRLVLAEALARQGEDELARRQHAQLKAVAAQQLGAQNWLVRLSEERALRIGVAKN